MSNVSLKLILTSSLTYWPNTGSRNRWLTAPRCYVHFLTKLKFFGIFTSPDKMWNIGSLQKRRQETHQLDKRSTTESPICKRSSAHHCSSRDNAWDDIQSSCQLLSLVDAIMSSINNDADWSIVSYDHQSSRYCPSFSISMMNGWSITQ